MLVSKDVYVLINYTSFVESIFMALSVVGLFVLRYTQPDLHRPIKVFNNTSVNDIIALTKDNHFYARM